MSCPLKKNIEILLSIKLKYSDAPFRKIIIDATDQERYSEAHRNFTHKLNTSILTDEELNNFKFEWDYHAHDLRSFRFFESIPQQNGNTFDVHRSKLASFCDTGHAEEEELQ